jgi:hypothetical protein
VPGADKWIGCLNEDSELYRAGKEHTAPLAREVNRYVFEDHTQDPKGAFLDRKKRLLKLFEQALVQLDEERFFGSGKKRSTVLLKIEAETEEADKNLGEQTVIRIATEFLRREKHAFDHCDAAYPVRNESIFPSLTKLLGLKERPRQVWQVFFQATDAPQGQVVVIVDPATGRCAIES